MLDTPIPEPRKPEGETAAPICKCGATSRSAKNPQRCSNGHTLVGNTEALIHGLFSARTKQTATEDDDTREVPLTTVADVDALQEEHLRWLHRLCATLAKQPPVTSKGTLRYAAVTAQLKAQEAAQKLIERIRASRIESGDVSRTREMEIANLSLEQLHALSASHTARLAELLAREQETQRNPEVITIAVPEVSHG